MVCGPAASALHLVDLKWLAASTVREHVEFQRVHPYSNGLKYKLTVERVLRQIVSQRCHAHLHAHEPELSYCTP